jgi:hypothetical protein
MLIRSLTADLVGKVSGLSNSELDSEKGSGLIHGKSLEKFAHHRRCSLGLGRESKFPSNGDIA